MEIAEKKTVTSGGKRAGAGRRSIEPGKRKVTIAIAIRPELRERVLTCARDAGISVSAFADAAFEEELSKRKRLPDSMEGK